MVGFAASINHKIFLIMKKVFALFFALLVSQVAFAQNGDVNGDGKVNAVDASYILSEYASTSTGHKPSFDPEKRKSADVNGDGAVNAVDASIVLSYYAYRGSGGTIEDLREWLK